MKSLIITMILIFGTQASGLESISDSLELQKLIEAHQYEVEASGEFNVFENTWVDPIHGGFINFSCVGDNTAEQVLNYFKDIVDDTDIEKSIKLKAYSDFYSILDNGEDYVACEGSTSVPFYFVTYMIFTNSKYKIGFEIGEEN